MMNNLLRRKMQKETLKTLCIAWLTDIQSDIL